MTFTPTHRCSCRCFAKASTGAPRARLYHPPPACLCQHARAFGALATLSDPLVWRYSCSQPLHVLSPSCTTNHAPREGPMTRRLLGLPLTALFAAALPMTALSQEAPQGAPFFTNCMYGFAIIFPDRPE